MKKIIAFGVLHFFVAAVLFGQGGSRPARLLSHIDLVYLRGLTRDVLDSSRIRPGQKVSDEFGSNHTGGTLIRPGGRATYPAFWIRDYAMSLASGFVTREEQWHMLQLTAATQCSQSWVSRPGSLIPAGAIADHIRIDDSKPVYFPGTYDPTDQGGRTWGMTPPYGDQFFFIHMAYYYGRTARSVKFLSREINGVRLIDRLEMAYCVPPTRQGGVLVYTTDDFRGVDFGFRDAIQITGDLCFPSLLKYRASLEMARLMEMAGRKDKAATYRAVAHRLKKNIPEVFSDGRGMLLASSGKSKQADVWSTSLAIYLGVLDGDRMEKAARFLRDAYIDGSLAKKGNIRHVLTTDDFSSTTAWEVSLAAKDNYQNGAYWGTPVGWVCYALAKVDTAAAKRLAKEYVDNLRADDFRRGGDHGGPWECYNAGWVRQNALYLATVACPYIVFSNGAGRY
ncbi:MAG TPA: hypothetical protein VGM31_19440 [Puia sp.]|jgi:hypothetical protein